MAPGAPPAARISVRATLDLLDGPFLPMAQGVSQDRYGLWLGSGISFDRVPSLRRIVERVLRFLQQQVVFGNPHCRFRRALGAVLSLAPLSPEEYARTDMERPIEDWPDLQAITQRLVTNYARMLDVPVDDEEADFLLWAGIDVPGTYADPATSPDAEHLCIALLALEGVASDIASPNWDGLVEKAASELSNGAAALMVLVKGEDTRGVQAGPRLYKFHGCAVRARNDAVNYRSKLVARQSQINGWALRQENVVIANRLIDMVTSKRTLMVGLSAQDTNIQSVFVAAQARMEWPWPSPEPACVISENELGIDQLGLLQNIYPTAYTAVTRNAIYQAAMIQAFAKPLLVALVLHVLCSKLSALASGAPGTLSGAGYVEISNGIVAVRNAVSELVEDLDHEPFVRELVANSERVLSFFRNGQEPAVGSRLYAPLSRGAVAATMNDPNLAASGLRELGIGVGLFGMGLRDGLWTLRSADRTDPKSGALRVEATSGGVNLFFAANSHAVLRLRTSGHVADDDNAVIIHSLEIPASLSRSPRGALGRTGKAMLREVSISELMSESVDAIGVFERFREETAL